MIILEKLEKEVCNFLAEHPQFCEIECLLNELTYAFSKSLGLKRTKQKEEARIMALDVEAVKERIISYAADIYSEHDRENLNRFLGDVLSQAENKVSI